MCHHQSLSWNGENWWRLYLEVENRGVHITYYRERSDFFSLGLDDLYLKIEDDIILFSRGYHANMDALCVDHRYGCYPEKDFMNFTPKQTRYEFPVWKNFLNCEIQMPGRSSMESLSGFSQSTHLHHYRLNLKIRIVFASVATRLTVIASRRWYSK